MNQEPNTLTRREALLGALQGTLAAALAAPVMVQAETSVAAESEVEFVPENDYPFFGYDPEEADSP